MKKTKKYFVFFAFMTVIILAFQNFSYQNENLYGYYTSQIGKCVAVNHTACQGEVVRFDYQQGAKWFDIYPGNDDTLYRGLRIIGAKNYELYSKFLSKQEVFRNTGVYSMYFKNRDVYLNPQLVEQFSSAFEPASQTLVSQPMRQVRYEFYNSVGAIPGSTEGLNYNVLGLVSKKTLVGVGEIINSYAPNGQLQWTSKYGIRRDFSYDVNGNVSKEYNWLDGVKVLQVGYSNYKRGIAQTVSRAGQHDEFNVVNDDGLVESSQDGNGRITRFNFDLVGREKLETPPVGLPTVTSYPDENTRVETRGNLEHTTRFNCLGKEIYKASKDLANPSSTLAKRTTYDLDGRVNFKSQFEWGAPSTYGEKTSYDVLDRVLEVTRTADNTKSSFSYSAPDKATVTNSDGYRMTSWFQNYGKPSGQFPIRIVQEKVMNPSSSDQVIVTSMRRDQDGKLIEVNQAGVVRKFIYNGNQLLAQTLEPEKAVTNHFYYAGSTLLKTKTVGNLPPTTYTYDAYGQQKEVKFANAADNIVYDYDKTGKTLSASTGGITRTFDYDENGNKKFEKISIDGYVFQFDFKYNTNDFQNFIQYPSVAAFGGAAAVDRNSVNLVLNAHGRPIEIFDSTQKIATGISYYPNAMFKSITYGNGLVSSLSLNNMQWPQVLKVSNGANAIVNLEYSYGKNSNVMKIEDRVDSRYSQYFDYDGIGRLISANFSNGSELLPSGAVSNLGGAIDYSDTSDIINYTEFGRPTTNMTYDILSGYLTKSTGGVARSYSYDQEGQMTSNQTFNFQYNSKRNLVAVIDPKSGLSRSSYFYDAGDIRVKKVVGPTTTYYFYINNRIMFEASPQNGTKEYIYLGKSLLATREVKAGVSNYKYFHFNPISSTIAVSNSARSVTKENYNSFGSSMVSNAPFAAQTTVRFAGHVSDDEIGLIYMGARYYDPRVGRFLQPDPVSFTPENPQSFNRYAYANNNPHKFIDPDGKLVPMVVFAGLMAVDVGMSLYDIYKGDYISGGVGLAMAAMGPVKVVGTAAKAVEAATKGKEAISIFHYGPPGLKEIVPQGGGNIFQNTTFGIHIKEAFLQGKIFSDPAVYNRMAFEKGKISASLTKSGTVPYMEKYGGAGSIYELKVAKESLIPSSSAPRSTQLLESKTFKSEVFVEGTVPVFREFKPPPGKSWYDLF